MADSLKYQAYSIIKNKIINCEYAPNMLLNEELLCKEIHVSRTPVRDAISRLEQDSLVTILPKKGVLVAPLTVNEINTIYETRMLLEPYILSTYGTRITREILQRMQILIMSVHTDTKGCKAAETRQYYDFDDEYHHIIVNLSENKYLIQCYGNIISNNLRLRILCGNQLPDRLLVTRQEHIRIHDQIIRRNYDQAADALKQHLLSAKEAAYKVLMNAGYFNQEDIVCT